jgi:hypothetical protein
VQMAGIARAMRTSLICILNEVGGVGWLVRLEGV